MNLVEALVDSSLEHGSESGIEKDSTAGRWKLANSSNREVQDLERLSNQKPTRSQLWEVQRVVCT